MSNEEIINELKSAKKSSVNYMEILYNQNLPLIRKICLKYSCYGESLEDLLQQAYFGLFEAVRNYDNEHGVKFTTYFPFWIKQAITSYLGNCGTLIRIPARCKQNMFRYKNFVSNFQRDIGRNPTDEEIIENLKISLKELDTIKVFIYDIHSLDYEMNNENDNGPSMTLGECIEDDFVLDDTVIEQVYLNEQKEVLWRIVEDYTTEVENRILRAYFIDKTSVKEIAQKENVSPIRVHQIKQTGLAKLRKGKALKEINNKLYIALSRGYYSGLTRYKEKGFTSIVEEIAIDNIELEKLKSRIENSNYEEFSRIRRKLRIENQEEVNYG